MTEAQQFDDWLKANYLFDTSNFIKDEADREKAKATNPTRMAWHHQQQRIDELEKDRDEWKDSTISANCRFEIAENDVYKYQVETANMSLEIMQLQASNNHLREALEHADEFIRNGIEFGYIRMPDESLKGIDSAHDTPEIIRKALSATPAKDCQYGKDVGMPEYTCVGKCQYASTPAESLQAFENDVIEKCAKAIDEMVSVYTNNCNKYKAQGDDESLERNVNKGRAAISCAEVVRALKEVK